MDILVRKTRRRYSDREKASALAVFDATGSLTEASRISGIPDSTIHGWLSEKPCIVNSDVPLLRAGYAATPLDLASKFAEIPDLSTGEIGSRLRDPKQVKDIPLQHLLKASEVGTDKMQLLRNQPTSINETIERQELTMIVESALSAAIDVGLED
jgi:hypothetical protein